jgi:hypothetical protein
MKLTFTKIPDHYRNYIRDNHPLLLKLRQLKRT